jgi:hypothetical protein
MPGTRKLLQILETAVMNGISNDANFCLAARELEMA